MAASDYETRFIGMGGQRNNRKWSDWSPISKTSHKLTTLLDGDCPIDTLEIKYGGGGKRQIRRKASAR
jgi:hypothetical protein